jgi:UDP-GlcNAc:undecaprenyl-phosphate/decaprenyl-phosphate GlcNAc-1-phosphate transferase
MDTLAVIIHRIRNRDSPFKTDRSHMHYILLDLGFSSRWTLVILVVFSMLLAAVGVIKEIKQIPEPYLFYGMLILFAIYYYTSYRLLLKLKTGAIK